MNKLVFASAVALTIATPAYAQDEASTEFTGPWVAAIGGIDAMTIQENDEADSARGPMFGGSLGYDFNAGSVVLGIEGEFTSSSADFDLEDVIVAGDSAAVKSGRDLYVGARAGLPTGNVLLYVKAGYVSAQHKSVYDFGTTHLEDSENKSGFRVGMGVEFGGKGFFGRGEMRYQDVGDFTAFGVPTGYARTNVQLVAAAGYRF